MVGAHNSNYVIAFYNDRVKEAVAVGDITEPFTFVPIRAAQMELVNGNAIAFGNITEGYDVQSLSVEAEIAYRDVSGEIARVDLLIYPWLVTPVYFRQLYDGGGRLWRTLRVYDCVLAIFLPTANVYEGSNYTVVFSNPVEGINATASYLAGPGDTPLDVKTGLEAAMVAAGIPVYPGFAFQPIWTYRREGTFVHSGINTLGEPSSDVWEDGDQNTVYKDWNIGTATVAYILSLGNTLKFPSLKCGAMHAFGVVYKDRHGRQCSVVKPPQFSMHIPFYTEELDNELHSLAEITFLLRHEAPEWADTYEIVYYGNMSMDWWMQIRANDIQPIGNDKYAISIQDTIDWTREQNPRWKVADYVWQEGDRARLIGVIDEVTSAVTKYDVLYDYEIEQVGTEYGEAIGSDWLICQAIEQPDPFDEEQNIILEIYRPRKGLAKTTPYGTGMVFGVGTDVYGRRYHKGNVDQVFDADGETIVPAEVVNLAHDGYKFARLNYRHESSIVQPFWAESIWPSDWWTWTIYNKLTSQGFPFLDDLNQKQVILTERIRHGGFLITGSRTNNIARFSSGDYLDLGKKDGHITGLREVGYVLKVLQFYKETSIYIQRIQSFNAEGTPDYVLTDKFFGTVYPLETAFGCQHPDGIMVNGRHLYYWDHSQGLFIRSAPNGQVVLDHKVKRWYRDMLTWVRSRGGAKALEVRIGMNVEHDEVWISFRVGDEATGLIFKETDNRYKSRLNLPTESYIHLGSFFAHLYRQRIWIMNIDENQDYLSWSGVPVHAEVQFISNVEPSKNKVFNAVIVYSDHQWTSESRSIEIPEEASGSNELMESNVSVWDRREGIYYGEILKDENSKGNFVSVNDRKMNGREMRGRYCFIRLLTEEHDEKVRLDSIIVTSTNSERSA